MTRVAVSTKATLAKAEEFSKKFHIPASELKFPEYGRVGIDIPSIEQQRATMQKIPLEYLELNGGYRYELWTPVIVARWTENDPISNVSKIVLKLVDGDHRRELIRIVCPEVETIPAMIHDVEDEKQAHRLCLAFQVDLKKPLSLDDQYNMRRGAGDESAIELFEKFKDLGVLPKNSQSTEENEIVVNQRIVGARTLRLALEKSIADEHWSEAIVGEKPTIDNIVKFAIELSEFWVSPGKTIPGQMLLGLTQLVCLQPNLMLNTKLRMKFTEWFRDTAANAGTTASRWAGEANKLGGNYKNKGEDYSAANGFAKKFVAAEKYCTRGTYAPMFDLLTIQNRINELHFPNKAPQKRAIID